MACDNHMCNQGVSGIVKCLYERRKRTTKLTYLHISNQLGYQSPTWFYNFVKQAELPVLQRNLCQDWRVVETILQIFEAYELKTDIGMVFDCELSQQAGRDVRCGAECLAKILITQLNWRNVTSADGS